MGRRPYCWDEGVEMGEGLVTDKRANLESVQTDPPVGTQHGNLARWVEEWKRVYEE